MKTWQSLIILPPLQAPISDIISALCPSQFISLHRHSLRLFFKNRQVWLCESPAWLQLKHPQTHDWACFTPSMHKNLKRTFLAANEKTPKVFQVTQTIPVCYSQMCWTCEIPQMTFKWTKTSSLDIITAKHGKINEAGPCFAHMANFGNVSSHVYFKQEIDLSVLQTCHLVAFSSLINYQQALLQ